MDKSTGEKWATKVVPIKVNNNDISPLEDDCDDDGMQSEVVDVIRELEIMSQFSDCNSFVQLHEFFEEVGGCDFVQVSSHCVYIVMELLQGGHLSEAVSQRGSLAEEDARGVFQSLMDACVVMQSADVVHRDLKLDNVLLKHPYCFHSGVKVIDMGLATRTYGKVIKDICGTPLFLAPEVIRTAYELSSLSPDNENGDHDDGGYGYTFPVDVWSCGIFLYILLCGFPPFDDDRSMLTDALCKQICCSPVDFSDPAWALVSEPAKDIVKRCLTKNPKQRITATEALRHPWLHLE